MIGQRARDAALAGTLLGLALGLAVRQRVALRPAVLGAGAVLALLAELLAYRRERQVRRLWASAVVRYASLAAAGAVLFVGALVRPVWSLSVAIGALLGYLSLLAGSVLLDTSADRSDQG